MLTAAELGAIPLFSKLPAHELEHLACKAADIQLATGESPARAGEIFDRSMKEW